ncbi:ankyrin repeat-containing domain protein [Stachybotrys elegans]|uniref:Ankyrin repeat-containing domain protein n=1 Tax=Stachybotrys elegans TaxID=80388 RepID=A0A8K0WL95_9HYPO|nr:ankyrin repeat-containing domain protein [Stachybotrys elegans]
MDPLSVTAGVVGILDTVTKLSGAISKFQHDYKAADEDIRFARKHALLLREEIQGLDALTLPSYTPSEPTKTHHLLDSHRNIPSGNTGMDKMSFNIAMSTARDLLSNIEEAFPLRSKPHTWKSKVRWAMKDKQALDSLKQQLKSAESTLQGVVATEQLRVSRMIYNLLQQQRPSFDDLNDHGSMGGKVVELPPKSQLRSHPGVTEIESKLASVTVTEDDMTTEFTTQVITMPNKYHPWSAKLEGMGITARFISLPKQEGTEYRLAAHMSLLGKIYSIRLQASLQNLSFDRLFHVHNVIPTDSEMALACKAGDFNSVRQLLMSGMGHGSDVTASGLPVLDYAINNGSTRLVRLLLEHGADPDMAYGEHNMTALQMCFLRNKPDIARMLLSKGADLEHVDNDGYSVLSYLWVNEGRLEESANLMRLCMAHGFTEVNACDSRGWTAFHRAAAIGTAEDVKAFLLLGASLDLRAEWYGWTALFFAASHDNVETFEAIVKHSGENVYQSLDGDGWNLLHCCTYFDAPNVMRMVLRSGVDVNQKTHPAPLPEDPELSYRELTAADIAIYVGPNRWQVFMDALADTGREEDLKGYDDVFWDAGIHEDTDDDTNSGKDAQVIYGAEDVDDRWSLLHWACYNGSSKVKRLLLLKGADPEHLDAIMMEDNPTLLPTSPFQGRDMD